MRQQRLSPKVSHTDLLWFALAIAIAAVSLGITAWQVWLAVR